jgi:predicted chitinase
VVGSTVSPPLELTIVPNDGTEYIMDIFNDTDDLGDEYKEGGYEGTEEELFKIKPGEPLPDVDIEALNDVKGFDPSNPNESLSTDSTNKYPVSKDKDANARAIIKAAKALGVTNKFAIVGILAIVSKESGFVPRSEASYASTSGARIIKIFGSKGKTAAEWDVIKKDPVKFFDLIYGGKYGNATNEGYKYRGRGFNQITFKGNYEQYAKDTGLNLVGDPDLLNTVDAAAKCVVAYFKRNIKNASSSIKSQYHFTDVNSFANLNDATGAMYHANAGWGKKYSEIVADSTGGRKKAFANAGPLYNTYQSAVA